MLHYLHKMSFRTILYLNYVSRKVIFVWKWTQTTCTNDFCKGRNECVFDTIIITKACPIFTYHGQWILIQSQRSYHAHHTAHSEINFIKFNQVFTIFQTTTKKFKAKRICIAKLSL